MTEILNALKPLIIGGIISLQGCLGTGCTIFKEGAIVIDEYRAKTHLGRAVGVIVSTETFVGLGFNEAHTDVTVEGTGEATFEKADDPVVDVSENNDG